MSSSYRHKILIVDDETSNLDALYGILKSSYDIVPAKNGGAAIQKATKHIPSLVLLDVVLPDMTGFDVIAILKNSDITGHIPIIFITGLDSAEDEERGLLLGAVDYITKPFNNSIVKARVKTHIQIVEYINTIARLCNVDALTGISNRRHFDTQGLKEWERAVREGAPIGILMLDIDHFKKYNDTYGHPQGDMLLKTIASVFKNSLYRPTDFVARYGGEEFVVVLPNTGIEGAMEMAERIRANVQKMVVPLAEGGISNVTVSIGVNSEVPDKGNSFESFISRADGALYNAKESGRNRAVAARD